MIEHLTAETFQPYLEQSPAPVLVDFWAEWCAPCRMMAPVVEEIADTVDNVAVAKLNIDEAPELALKYGVSAIPTLILFKDGKPAFTSVGLCDADELRQALAQNL